MVSLLEKPIESNDGPLLDLSEICIDIYARVIQSVGMGIGRYIGSGLDSSVVGEVDSGNDGEVGLEVGGEVGSRDEISVRKYIKSEVNVIIDNIVC